VAPSFELLALTRQVADRLPSPWTASEDLLDLGALWGPHAMGIVLSHSALGGRCLRGRLPPEIPRAEVPAWMRRRCRIRVFLAHDPDALAEAIQQRLLPSYEPLFHLLVDRSSAQPAIGSSRPHPAIEVEPVDRRLLRVSLEIPRDALPAVREALTSVIARPDQILARS
jgi:hypothetical protein